MSTIREPYISIIIPSLNDGALLHTSATRLSSHKICEVIIVEAGETVPQLAGVQIIKSAVKNRAAQMNIGAARAQGEFLVFLHADTSIQPATLPPLYQFFSEHPEYVAGSYRFSLDAQGWKARVVEWGVRLREMVFKLPYGDQALFVRRQVFEAVGGYPEVPLLEDVLLVERLKQRGKLYEFPERAITSARKWEQFGYLRMTLLNWGTMLRRSFGASLEELAEWRQQDQPQDPPPKTQNCAQ